MNDLERLLAFVDGANLLRTEVAECDGGHQQVSFQFDFEDHTPKKLATCVFDVTGSLVRMSFHELRDFKEIGRYKLPDVIE